MRCVKCAGDTRVLTTYQNEDGRVRRRRSCVDCDFRFTTREHPEVEGVELFSNEENRAQLEMFERDRARSFGED